MNIIVPLILLIATTALQIYCAIFTLIITFIIGTIYNIGFGIFGIVALVTKRPDFILIFQIGNIVSELLAFVGFVFAIIITVDINQCTWICGNYGLFVILTIIASLNIPSFIFMEWYLQKCRRFWMKNPPIQMGAPQPGVMMVPVTAVGGGVVPQGGRFVHESQMAGVYVNSVAPQSGEVTYFNAPSNQGYYPTVPGTQSTQPVLYSPVPGTQSAQPVLYSNIPGTQLAQPMAYTQQHVQAVPQGTVVQSLHPNIVPQLPQIATTSVQPVEVSPEIAPVILPVPTKQALSSNPYATSQIVSSYSNEHSAPEASSSEALSLHEDSSTAQS